MDTGLSNLNNVPASIGQTTIGGLYSIVAHILTWILLGLGLAFGFDLFRSDRTGQIAHGLHQAENAFTSPLLPLVLLIGAFIGVIYWLGQRQEGRAVAHWGMMLALVVVGLLVASNPIGVFGWFDSFASALTQGSLSAFSGSGGGTGSGFANATPGLYRTTMEEPWCSLEFGSVSWCMAPVDPKMAAARKSVLAHLPQALGDQGTPQLAAQQAPIERIRLNDAKTNGELFLAFIPNSNARNGKNDNWTLYHALLQDRPDLAALRGPGGFWERFGIFFLAGITGIIFLFLLLYIAWQLIVNSVFFVVCLLLAPVAVLAPAFGESGRGVFLRWFVWMIEALLKRVIFAIYLGVILLVTRVFLAVGPYLGGWLIQWLILAGVWAMAFGYRKKLLGLMSAGMYKEHSQPTVVRAAKQAARTYAWKRTPQRVQSTQEHHYEGDHHHGDQYHVHVDNNGNGNGYHREPAAAVQSARADIEGSARELEE